MPLIRIWPADGPATTGTPATNGTVDSSWAWITGPNGTLIATAITAAILGGLAVHLYKRNPGTTNASRNLMYVPLLLVNAAAVYGQVAFFYENVAPTDWPILGKLALAGVIAAAIESISVYVGWHAHDALLNKAGNTAARLRRASYVIAAFVASINYAHFAKVDVGNPFGLTAAAAAFGLLSLLSPWLWGLHTRRMQHVQLRREGVVDASGATFSGERIRSFPLRAYLARRWSIDNYVTDPRRAWEGYNAALQQRWATTVDSPGWWLRVNPIARVRQLVAALAERTSSLEKVTSELAAVTDTVAAAEKTAADLWARLQTASAELAEVISERDGHLRTIDQLTSELASTVAGHTSETATLRTSIAELEVRLVDLRADYEKRLADASAKHAQAFQDHDRKTSEKIAKIRVEASTINLAERRNRTTRGAAKTTSKTAPRQRLSDEDAVQVALALPAKPEKGLPPGAVREWNQSLIVSELEVGWSRAPRLLDAVVEEQRRRASEGGSGDQAVNQ